MKENEDLGSGQPFIALLEAFPLRLAEDGIDPVIPPKSNRKEQIPYDAAVYRQRNRVERFFKRLKHFRRIATRYEKYACTFLAMVHLTAAFLYLR